MEKVLPVSLENKFCYNIKFSFNWDGLIESLIEINPDISRKIAIITDSNVSELYLKEVYEIFKQKFNNVITFQMPAGEKNKTLDNVQKLYEVLISKKFYRGDLLVALGGGVIGDMTGFCAATYLRGIDFIQIPTTLLSQVDSRIGGKTGVDFKEFKNMIGAFYMPRLVFINTSLLKTLPKEQFSSGMGEVIKHGIIRNRAYFEWLDTNEDAIKSFDLDALSNMVYESCLVKRDVVQIDPKETGLRAILNFGHTIGHAIEKCSNFSLFHGHCVALGSIAASYISKSMGMISSDDYEYIKNLFIKYDLPIKTKISDVDRIYETTLSDKKMTSEGIKFVLIDYIGEAVIHKGIDKELITKAIGEING